MSAARYNDSGVRTRRGLSGGLFIAAALFVGGPALRADPVATVTVEAQRARLRSQVNEFVAATIVQPRYDDESLLRWDSAICPLVAGFPREQGEFFLQRISQAAREAKAPLGGETCRPNLFVIGAQKPDVFLKLWWRHDPRLFNTVHGIEPAERFIKTSRPVRVWYNDSPIDPDSASEIAPLLGQSIGINLGQASFPTHLATGRTGSRLQYMMVRAVASAIVVIDTGQVSNINIGQLADYVSMVSLAEIDLDKSVGSIPSILTLFRGDAQPQPEALTVWDRSLLHSVYNSRQKDKMQFSEICNGTLDALLATAATAQPAPTADGSH
jgi:hypothetical protein